MVGSTEVEVKVLWKGREIKRIRRPVRTVDGCEMVTYKGTLHPLQPGGIIELHRLPTDTPAVEKITVPLIVVSTPNNCLRLDVPTEWDEPQKSVIQAPPDRRQLVDAGPGTGKTAVACARVARLIDHYDISPSAIWFISFTRTAVQEIRHRLGAYLTDGRAVFAVKIATIDSHAWALHSGFEKKASLTGSYDENIERVIELIRSHEGVFEHLQSVAHLVVDEAQDVVGPRAELVVALVESLSVSSGVTIFSDEAQAIYESGDEDGGSGVCSRGGLVQQLRDSPLGFIGCELRDVRRTSDTQLLQIFTDVRRMVLDPHSPAMATKFTAVRERVLKLAHITVSELKQAIPEGDASKSAFALFRRRADALRASSFQGLIPHRLRMSGLPAVIEPWIGVMFTDFTSKRISRKEFEARWPKVTEIVPPPLDVQAAWQLLVRLAGESETLVSVLELRRKLSRRSPAAEVCRPDFGLPGPLFGTIHGSKGREADHVALMVPQDRADPAKVDPDREDYEARVLFVGATRARRNLIAVSPFRSGRVRKTESERACILLKGPNPRAQVEIGREEDLRAEGLAGRSRFASADDVRLAQDWLLLNAGRMHSAVAAARGADFAYHVSAERDTPAFAVLDIHLNHDLFEIGRMLSQQAGTGARLRPSGWIPHIRVFGARTFAVPAGNDSSGLHEPWSVSGFLLAPLIHAFTAVEFVPYER